MPKCGPMAARPKISLRLSSTPATAAAAAAAAAAEKFKYLNKLNYNRGPYISLYCFYRIFLLHVITYTYGISINTCEYYLQ